ncbi:MAG: hypothetical protein E6K72_10925, partial [Candidatus Eisenbacteria bacterium]
MTVSSRHRHPQPDPPHGVHGDREAPGRPQFIENGRESPGCAGSSAAAAPLKMREWCQSLLYGGWIEGQTVGSVMRLASHSQQPFDRGEMCHGSRWSGLRLRSCRAVLALALLAPGSSRAHEPPGRAGEAIAAVPAPQQSSGATMFPPYPYRAKEFAFIHAGGLFHLFYMRHDLSALDDDSSDVDVGHAVSQNLTDWTQLDPVLHVRPDNWDNWHVWAPTIICQKDTFYMYYTGVTRVMTFRAYQRIGLATSTDLVHWSRYDAPVFDGNRVPWAFADSSQDAGCQFRDPFVMV